MGSRPEVVRRRRNSLPYKSFCKGTRHLYGVSAASRFRWACHVNIAKQQRGTFCKRKRPLNVNSDFFDSLKYSIKLSFLSSELSCNFTDFFAQRFIQVIIFHTPFPVISDSRWCIHTCIVIKLEPVLHRNNTYL